jgi:uncharacterized protein
MDSTRSHTAFAGDRQIASGSLQVVLPKTKARLVGGERETVLFFEDDSGKQVDFDLRGSTDEIVARAIPTPLPPGPGRPKLGVVSREVTLLPRHWEWLEAQPSGSSAALRRLVEEASKRDPQNEAGRRAIEATSRAMTALAGNRPGYEEAARALFQRDWARFASSLRAWPEDVRKYLRRLALPAMRASPPAGNPKRAR